MSAEPESRRRPRVAVISQGLGRIDPPRAWGSISIWTYEIARRLRLDYSVVLLEFGQEAFKHRFLEYDGIKCIYLPNAWNRGWNKIHSAA